MSLGNVLATAAPIAAGYFAPGAGAFLGNATANAVAMGALTGAGIAALSGGDILSSGVMGGLGGYAGGEMFGAFNPAAGVDASVKAGTTTAVTNEAMLSPYTNATASKAAGTAGSNMGMFSNAQAVNLGNPVTNASMSNAMSNAIGANTPVGLNSANAFPSNTVGANTPVGLNSARLPTKSLAPGAYGTVPNPTTGGASRVPGIPDKFSGGYDPSTGVAGEVAYTTPGGYIDTSFSAGVERLGDGSMSKGAMKLGLAGLPILAAAYEPETFTYDQMREAEAYDPDATLNLDDPALDSGIEDVIDSDSGLRLYAKEGGMIPTYAEGGTIESRANQGMRDALARNQGTAYAQPTTTAPSNNIKIAGADNSTSNIRGGVGSLNVGSGTIGQSPNAIAEAARLKAIEDAKPKYTTPRSGVNVGGGGGPGSFSVPSELVVGQGYMPTGAIMAGPAANYYRDIAGNYIRRAEGGPIPAAYAQGGMTSVGFLKGPGDGMSDSLAAQIDGSQPAALSQGEFVVPADVVSHLGNGSSDAGSKRLYAMMDEVRQARTGTEKQGKEINPERYMPA